VERVDIRRFIVKRDDDGKFRVVFGDAHGRESCRRRTSNSSRGSKVTSGFYPMRRWALPDAHRE
jgi:hypothetical protein